MKPQRAGVVGNDCPAPDVLVAAGEGVLPESLDHCVQLHLHWCRRCAMLKRELSASALGEPTLEEITRVRQRIQGSTRRVRRPRLKYGAVAAAIAANQEVCPGWG